MSALLLQLTKTDFVLQWRYRIVAAYVFVIGLYSAIIIFVGEALPGWVLALLIFSDPAVFGFFFLGGLMMLEKGENIRAALAISPTSTTQYLMAKTISLTTIAVAAVLVLCLVAQTPFASIPLILFATICTSVMFTALGAIVALQFKTVSGYLIGSIPIILPLIAPVVALIYEPLPTLVYVFPTIAQVKLLLVAFNVGTASSPVFVVSILTCLISALMCFFGAAHYLRKELGAK